MKFTVALGALLVVSLAAAPAMGESLGQRQGLSAKFMHYLPSLNEDARIMGAWQTAFMLLTWRVPNGDFALGCPPRQSMPAPCTHTARPHRLYSHRALRISLEGERPMPMGVCACMQPP
jgi:hypothetical protein